MRPSENAPTQDNDGEGRRDYFILVDRVQGHHRQRQSLLRARLVANVSARFELLGWYRIFSNIKQ